MTEQNVKDTLNPGGPPGAPGSGASGAGAAAAVLERPATSRPGGPAGLDARPDAPGADSRIAAQAVVPEVRDADAPEAAEPPLPVQTTESIVRPSHAGLLAGGPGPLPPIVPAPGSLDLEAWFATPQGAYVLNWELARVDQVVADIFGYYAVQVGLPGIDFLRANRITSRLTASLRGTPSVVADAHELPFENESLDLVILPHLLEFSSEPHQILREVERVLRPEGQVVILCFNPVSLWGVKKLFAAPPHAPWSGEFVSVLRMKDWLKLLNFEMRGGRFGCYRPPYTSEKWLGRLGFLEHAGDRWWPVAGAVYLMQAKKRVPGMRIITPAWRKQRVKAEALAPSTNGANRDNHGPATHAPQPVHHNLRNPKETE